MNSATLFKDVLQGLQALFTIIGIVVAGAWTYLLFIRTRQKYPRAHLEHKVSFWPLRDGSTLMRASLYVRNDSQVLISLENGRACVQQMLPFAPEIEEQIAKSCDPVIEGETEMAWPVLCTREVQLSDGQREIEPSESEEFHYDFVLPSETEVISIYTYLQNMHKAPRWGFSWGDIQPERKSGIGWHLTTTHVIAKQGNPVIVP